MRFRSMLVAAACLVAIPFAQAEPTSNPMKVTYRRPYAGTTVFFATDVAPGSFCPTSNYSIDIGTAAGKAQYATLLAALVAGKFVQLELVSAACGGGAAPYYNAVLSVYILP